MTSDDEIVFVGCQHHVTEKPEVIMDSGCESHICFVSQTEVHDAQLSATGNINTVSAAENINAAEKKKVLGPVGLLKEVGKG